MKYWSTRLLILLLFLLAGLSAYNYFQKPFAKDVAPQSTAVPTLTPPPSKTPKKELNVKQKIAQLLMIPLDLNELQPVSTASASMLNFIDDYEPGFILYFGEEISTASAVFAGQQIQSKFTDQDYLPLLAVDHEGGSVQRLSGAGFTKLDPWQKVVADYSVTQQRALYNQSAKELYTVGVNIVFAPVLDLASQSAVLRTRVGAHSEETYLAAGSYILSFSQHGIMPVIKHFPGIGSIKIDPHKAASTISLKEDDTAIFSNVLAKFNNVGVMTAHVRLENKLAGKVCSLSEECLGKLVELYPKSLIFTDDLSMKSALSQPATNEEKTLAAVAVEAVEAGNNVLVFGRGVKATDLEQVIFALQAKYDDSESFRNKVNFSVEKILKLKK